MEPQDVVLRCHAIHSRNGPVTGQVEVTVSVDSEGRATGVATPPGTDERVAAAAQCVGISLRYQPAVEADVAVPGQLTLPWMTEAAKCVADRLEFYPASLRTTTVESWAILPLEFNLTRNPHYDAEVSPPTLRSGEQAIMEAYRRCYPPGRTDTEGGRVR